MENKAIPFGRYFEEFEIGDVYKHWPGKTITESDNNLFSLLTMNHHPVHLDLNYATSQQHGKILVVGTLVFSLVVGMSVKDVSGNAIANLAYHEVKHLNPVFIGDTIYAETKVLEKTESKSKPDRGSVKVETIAYNQRKEAVLSFSRTVLIPKMKLK
ncbi:MAG TPA: dehydratase [Bacteroidales bacterium]|nr:MAG: dehydratase [Bacteroidetes bacterium GWF2_33_38]OFY89236.1 MAG: dehydratase [Bacteroidetes bacterium RIFOXYA2_FULL_33_7]HBF87363.1 dehydratase [Bacteroidales bacterium]